MVGEKQPSRNRCIRSYSCSQDMPSPSSACSVGRDRPKNRSDSALTGLGASSAACSAPAGAVSGLILSCTGASRKLHPGSSVRTEDICGPTCLMQSPTVPSGSTKMMFECLPISSVTSCTSMRSPSSLRVSTQMVSTRSSSRWRIETMRPPESRRRSSMQNMGGSGGFTKLCSVSCTLPFSACAESSSL